METTDTFGYALYPGLRKWYEDGLKTVSDYVPMVFSVESSSQAFEEEAGNTGVGYMEETGQATSTKYEDRIALPKTRYTHKKYTKGIEVTREEYEDNLYMKREGEFSSLGKSSVRTPNKFAFSVFVNGFSTSYTSYGDAKPLFSTSHTRYDGGTAQSNASATGITLTEPNLNTGVLAMQEVLDDKGQGIVVAESSVTLMVPPALRKTAVEITDSERKADTADNNMNYYAGWVNVLVNPWISARFGGSDTAWFLLAPKGETYLKYFWRRQPEFKQEDVFDTEVAKYRASARWSYGWSHWLGAWGSKGDGAAYSS